MYGDRRMTKWYFFRIIFTVVLLLVVIYVAYQKWTDDRIVQINLNQEILLLKGCGHKLEEGTSPSYCGKIDPSQLVSLNIAPNITGSECEQLFTRYSESIEVICDKKERLGRNGEGGWEMCVDPRFVPKKPCLIYSFGINNDWIFDDACDAKFNCVHRAFDPSMKAVNHKRGKNIFFYADGLAGKDTVIADKLWRLSTLHTYMKLFNESDTVIDYLKIDVEYWEWESLQTALEQGALKNVKQLGVEVHRDELDAKSSSIGSYKRFFKLFDGLRLHGFYKWYWHLNPYSVTVLSSYSNTKIMCCYEFIFLNANFL